MKKDIYNFKINPPQPSSEDIAKHKDFDALLQQFQETSLPAEKETTQKPRIVWLRYAAATAAVIMLGLFAQGLLQGGDSMTEEEFFASQPFINPPLTNIKPTFASQKVNANQGGVYEYNNGSKLIVPAAAFVSNDGKTIEGEVDIKYREMHDFVDFFLSGIPMTYDSAGTQYILESAGMVEIYAEQNGQRLQMQPGKEIKVELISHINMPRLNVSPKYNIYKLDEDKRNWEYKDIDHIQIIEDMDADETPNEYIVQFKNEYNNALAKIDANEKAELNRLNIGNIPTAPIKPFKSDKNKLSFDIDIADSASDAVRALGQKYKSVIWHISPNSPAINPNALRVDWESMDLKPISGQDYELTLINGDRTERVIVTPALSGEDYTKAMSVYQGELDDYNKVLKDNELRIKSQKETLIAKYAPQRELALQQYNSKIENFAKEHQDDPSINKIVRRKIINRFIANSFGVWNCDRPLHPKDIQIEGNFANDRDAMVAKDIAYLVNKNRNTIVRIYAKDGAKVNFDQKADNLMWMVTKNNEIAIFKPKEFKRINEKKDKHTFMMKVEPNALKSEEDVRKVLQFKEM